MLRSIRMLGEPPPSMPWIDILKECQCTFSQPFICFLLYSLIFFKMHDVWLCECFTATQPQFSEGRRAQKRVAPYASHMGREVKVILFLYCRKQRTQSPLEIVPVGALPNRRFEPELNVSSAFC